MTKEFRHLSRLMGKTLTEIDFLEGYFQLVFDRYRLSVFTKPMLLAPDASYVLGDGRFRDALCELIPSRVVEVAATAAEVKISFNEGSKLVIPIKGEASALEALALIKDGVMLWLLYQEE